MNYDSYQTIIQAKCIIFEIIFIVINNFLDIKNNLPREYKKLFNRFYIFTDIIKELMLE